MNKKNINKKDFLKYKPVSHKKINMLSDAAFVSLYIFSQTIEPSFQFLKIVLLLSPAYGLWTPNEAFFH